MTRRTLDSRGKCAPGDTDMCPNLAAIFARGNESGHSRGQTRGRRKAAPCGRTHVAHTTRNLTNLVDAGADGGALIPLWAASSNSPALCCEGDQSRRCGGTCAGSVARCARPSFLSGRPCCRARTAGNDAGGGYLGEQSSTRRHNFKPAVGSSSRAAEGQADSAAHTHSRTHTLSFNSGIACRRPEPCTASAVSRGTLSHASGDGSYPEINSRSRNLASRRYVARSRVHTAKSLFADISDSPTFPRRINVEYPKVHDRKNLSEANIRSTRAKRKSRQRGRRTRRESKVKFFLPCSTESARTVERALHFLACRALRASAASRGASA